MPRTPAKRKAKEPPINGDRDQQENDEQQDEDAAATPPSTKPLTTPEMRLRSGRKKRRRSKETSGLTPPDTTVNQKKKRTEAPAKKRARKDVVDEKKQEDEDMLDEDEVEMEEASEQEDEEMESKEQQEEEKEEEEEEDRKMPAVDDTHPAQAATAEVPSPAQANGRAGPVRRSAKEPPAATTTTKAASKASSKKEVPPIANLRLPSQHTPGKKAPPPAQQQEPPQQETNGSSVEDYIASIATHQRQEPSTDEPSAPPPEVNRVTHDGSARSEPETELESVMAPPEQKGESLRDQLFRQASDRVVTMVTTIREVTTTMILPTRSDGVVADDDEAYVERFDYKALFLRIEVWLVVLLLLQLVFWPIWINPVLTTVMEVSDGSVRFYKGLLGVRPIVTENVTDWELPAATPGSKLNATDSLTDLESVLSNLKDAKWQFQMNMGQTRNALNRKVTEMNELKAAVTQVESTLQSILASSSGSPDFLPSLMERAQDEIIKLKYKSSEKILSEELLEIGSKPLWQPSDAPPSCAPTDVPVSKDPLVSPKRFADSQTDLQKLVLSSFETMKEDLLEAAKAWTKAQVKAQIEELPKDVPPSNLFDGMTEDDVRNVIQNRLERDLADQTGQIDYAALHAGSSIIRSGPRATSPSLSESLPLFNRIMHMVGLRFYGFGPEAALTPTRPVNALGQCWAFEDVSNSKKPRWRDAYQMDGTNGKAGTLSIRLAKPVRVKSVVLEHVPMDSTKQLGSAISHFRLFGYTNGNASGIPVALGEFNFEHDASETMTEFPLANQEIPFQSLTLAIDSNQGLEHWRRRQYTCLYRFRVHGQQI